MKPQDYLRTLGCAATDRVTGRTGIITSIGFDLYGCVQAVLTPRVDKDNKPGEGNWYDFHRLKIKGEPVMEQPAFVEQMSTTAPKGPAGKPLMSAV